jgi:hypothetical protein
VICAGAGLRALRKRHLNSELWLPVGASPSCCRMVVWAAVMLAGSGHGYVGGLPAACSFWRITALLGR